MSLVALSFRTEAGSYRTSLEKGCRPGWPAEGSLALLFQHVLEGFDDLTGGGTPGLGLGIDFFQRVDDVFAV